MSKQPTAKRAGGECDDGAVARFLREHPAFFDRHADLLGELTIPHASGAAVSLVERQVETLREQNRQLRHRMMQLVETARDNDRLLERLLEFTVHLLAVEQAATLPERVVAGVRTGFNADAVALKLFGAADTARETAEPVLGNVLRAGRPVCGKPKPGQLEYLFGDDAPEIESAALVPLGAGGVHGILAIGSYDEQRFHPEMGKVFLEHIGRAIGTVLDRLGTA